MVDTLWINISAGIYLQSINKSHLNNYCSYNPEVVELDIKYRIFDKHEIYILQYKNHYEKL